MYHQGRLVVNLQGGSFDLSDRQIYDIDTLQLVFSTIKGLVAAALCVQQGLLNYSALVTKYWPEYDHQKGKERTTVTDILSHRAGLPNDPAAIDQFFNWTAMIHLLEQEAPVWPSGTAQGYHALTFGWLAGELIRRVDPKKRSLGQFIQDEIARRVALEFYIGLPSDKENCVSPLIFQDNVGILNKSQLAFYERYNEARIHQADIPGANGITNARSLAKLYASLIGNINGQSNSRLIKEEIIKEAIEKPTRTDYEIDVTLQTAFPLAKGFMLYDRDYPFLGPDGFGHTGNITIDHECFTDSFDFRSWWKYLIRCTCQKQVLRLCDEPMLCRSHSIGTSKITYYECHWSFHQYVHMNNQYC